MECIQLTLFGKTCPEACPAAKAGISESSCKVSAKSKTPACQYLNLRVESGGAREPLWETVTALPGESWTPSFGESPNAAAESFLSWIVEDTAPEKYFLSPKACRGILRRAEKRGKPLPPALLKALTEQAGAEILSDRGPTLSCNHEAPFITCPSVSGTLCGSGAGLSRPAGMASELDFCVLSVDCRNLRETPEKSGVLQSKPTGGYSLNYQNPIHIGRAVRRLTPVECERLQGFPDGWTDIGPYTDETGKTRQSSDTARYSALGNSVAVPVVRHIMSRIARRIQTIERSKQP